MSRYIDIEPYEKDGWYLQKTYYDTYGAGVKTTPLISVPTAEAEPVRHGRWIVLHGVLAGDGIYGDMGECSNCGLHLRNWEWDYCPNCGAKMDGEENDDR